MSEPNTSATKKKVGLAPATVHTLTELAQTTPDSTVSRILHRNPAGNITVFAFGAGQGLSPHTAPFDAYVQVLSGVAEVVIAGEPLTLQAGQCVLMPAHVEHSVHAPQDFQMLLVMLRG